MRVLSIRKPERAFLLGGKMKRLIFDIETSPNIGFFWQAGHEIEVGTEFIIKERAVICICWKWAKQKKVHSITWHKGNDKKMLKEFVSILDQADEVLAHNGDNFDIKWLRTRCIYYRIPFKPFITSIDTLKDFRRLFRMNSNRLDYVGEYLGLGRKRNSGGTDTWKRIMMKNDVAAMRKMVRYCKQDVILLEKIWDVLNPYVAPKTHYGTWFNECPECGLQRLRKRNRRVSASGVGKYEMQCQNCGKWCTIPESKLKKIGRV